MINNAYTFQNKVLVDRTQNIVFNIKGLFWDVKNLSIVK